VLKREPSPFIKKSTVVLLLSLYNNIIRSKCLAMVDKKDLENTQKTSRYIKRRRIYA